MNGGAKTCVYSLAFLKLTDIFKFESIRQKGYYSGAMVDLALIVGVSCLKYIGNSFFQKAVRPFAVGGMVVLSFFYVCFLAALCLAAFIFSLIHVTKAGSPLPEWRKLCSWEEDEYGVSQPAISKVDGT